MVLSIFTGHTAGQVADKAGELHQDCVKEYLMSQLIKYTELRSIMPETGSAAAALEYTQKRAVHRMKKRLVVHIVDLDWHRAID